ncbi:MAG: hypothetical protein RJA99_3625 [Pseudomonadota bacterium]|jgi:putative FmdB family regulatory protein
MPIYAYRCESCGHAKDVIQKFSDAPLTVCPSCGAEAFRKQLTAPAFQLKGSGWYVTDFRDNGKKAGGTSKTESGEASGSSAGEAAKPAETSKSETSKSETAAAPAPAPAAAKSQPET